MNSPLNARSSIPIVSEVSNRVRLVSSYGTLVHSILSGRRHCLCTSLLQLHARLELPLRLVKVVLSSGDSSWVHNQLISQPVHGPALFLRESVTSAG
jgi:hypothetical protein